MKKSYFVFGLIGLLALSLGIMSGCGSAASSSGGGGATVISNSVFFVRSFGETASRTKEVMSMLKDGSNVLRLTNSPTNENIMYLAVSPDGTKVAFSRYNYGEGTYRIYLINPDGSNLQVVSTGEYKFCWSPDSHKLAYVAPGNDIYMVNISDLYTKVLVTGETGSSPPSWSKNGNMIAYPATGFTELCIAYLNGLTVTSTESIITGTSVSRPVFSPTDNNILVFAESSQLNKIDLATRSLVTFETSIDPQGRPVWAPDGSSVYYDDSGAGRNIYKYEFGASRTTVCTGGSDYNYLPTIYPGVTDRLYVTRFYSSMLGSTAEVVSMNLDGSDQQRLTDNAVLDCMSPTTINMESY